MILSTKGRYAVTAMVDLASKQTEKPVSLSSIAEAQDIPLAYLEQIFAKLKRAGLVESVRGPGGGYRLAKLAAEIWVVEIIRAAEESFEMTRCTQAHQGCGSKGARCLTHDLWEGLTQQIEVYLAAISLEDICEEKVWQKTANKVTAQLQAQIN